MVLPLLKIIKILKRRLLTRGKSALITAGELSQGKNYNRKEGLFNFWWCFLKVEIYLLWASGNIFMKLKKWEVFIKVNNTK